MAFLTIFAIVCALSVCAFIVLKPEFGIYTLVMLTSCGVITQYLPFSPMKTIGAILAVAWLFKSLQKKKMGDARSPISLFIIIFLAASVISIFSAINISGASYALQRLVLLVIAYFLFVAFIQNHRQIKIVFWILVISGLADTAFGYLNMKQESLVKIMSDIVQSPGTANIFRVGGFTGDPNFLALYLVALIPIAFYLMIEEKKIWQRILAGACFVTFGYFVILTYSRGGFIGLIFTLVLILFKFHRRLKTTIAVGLAIILMIAFAPKAYWGRVSTIGDFVKNQNSADASLEYRLGYLKLGEEMFFSNPIIGVGIGNYMESLPSGRILTKNEAHNTYIEIAAEAGIIGIVSFMLIIWLTLVSLRRTRYIMRRVGDRQLEGLSEALELSLLSFIVGAIFLSAQYEKTFWFIVAMSIVLRNIAYKEYIGKYKNIQTS